MRLPLFPVFFICLFSFSLAGQTTQLIRYPAINPDGKELSFSYQGDIWTVSADGGQARRLTIHESYESHPQWNADGSLIVFQGNRHSNTDIFVIDKNGQQLERKSYHSANDEWPRWGKDGAVWFNTRRLWAQVEREDEIFQFQPNVATPVRAIGSLGLHPAPHPKMDFVAFERGTCRTTREAYKGPANRNIWLYDQNKDTYHQITSFEGQDHLPDWGDNNRLYFLSARNGKYNIYYVTCSNLNAAPEFSEPVAVTRFKDEGIRHFDVNLNGDIVFEKGTDIYVQKAGARRPEKVLIQVSEDARFYPIEKQSMSSGASEYALSPNEKNIALGLRGELFVTQNDKEKSRTVRLTKHPCRDQHAEWLNDSTLLFISDREGQEDMYKIESADTSTADLFKSLKPRVTRLTTTDEAETYFLLSNNRKHIAIQRGRGKLLVADIDSLGNISNEKMLLNGWATPGDLAWSPDDQWLAYSLPDLDFNEEVYIHKADGSKAPVNVSMHPRSDESPYWSPDGSKLGFISNRNNGDADVWFVWLKKSDWEKTRYDWEDEDEDEPGEKGNGPNDKKQVKKDSVATVQIDFEDIHRRIEQATRQAGNEGNPMITPDGEYFIYTTNNSGRTGGGGARDLKKIKWDGSDETTLIQDTPVNRLSMDKKGKKLYYMAAGGLKVLDLDNKKSEPRPFSARMTIDHRAERQQIFEELWRALNAGFYDPEFHGRDWEQLKEYYRDRAISASTTQDFQDMVNEMLGQLDASHMGLRSGSTPEDPQPDQTGYLGIEVKPLDKGVEITRKIQDTPADRQSSRLEVGEVITAVNGTPVNSATNFWNLLDETRNERIYLNVEGKNGAREVVIRPTSSVSAALYEDWVRERRRLTDEYSNGQLGYIHIRGMNWPSFEAFERELTASGYGKKGIVIDVRFNGGGWTTDMLMAILNTRQHAYTIPRGASASLKKHKEFINNYPFGERLPFPHLKIPSIAMCNENSYSNAEIFSHAYKTLGHGKLVGQPTFGAVISTGSHSLLDGSYVRMPYRAWFVKATEENMEHGPAVPDIIVADPPDAKEKGSDPQLKRAVEELMKEIN